MSTETTEKSTPEITFRYRIYTFENDYGNRIYQVKRPLGIYTLWMYEWVLCYPCIGPRQWDTREGAMEWIRADAQSRRNDIALESAAMKKAKLRLIVKEDIRA